MTALDARFTFRPDFGLAPADSRVIAARNPDTGRWTLADVYGCLWDHDDGEWAIVREPADRHCYATLHDALLQLPAALAWQAAFYAPLLTICPDHPVKDTP